MGFPILVRWHLYIESGPRWHTWHSVIEAPACRLTLYSEANDNFINILPISLIQVGNFFFLCKKYSSVSDKLFWRLINEIQVHFSLGTRWVGTYLQRSLSTHVKVGSTNQQWMQKTANIQHHHKHWYPTKIQFVKMKDQCWISYALHATQYIYRHLFINYLQLMQIRVLARMF